MSNDFIKAIGNNKKLPEVEAVFANGTRAIYPARIYSLLASDKSVKRIIDKETGEILLNR